MLMDSRSSLSDMAIDLVPNQYLTGLAHAIRKHFVVSIMVAHRSAMAGLSEALR